MCIFGLAEETGEVLGIFKGRERNYAKDRARCGEDDLKSELGDVLWYLTALCELYDMSLDEIYRYNCAKLTERGWRK
jgi:NTP pyrophosphatase (non-canonical NTP hydrolase)